MTCKPNAFNFVESRKANYPFTDGIIIWMEGEETVLGNKHKTLQKLHRCPTSEQQPQPIIILEKNLVTLPKKKEQQQQKNPVETNNLIQ